MTCNGIWVPKVPAVPPKPAVPIVHTSALGTSSDSLSASAACIVDPLPAPSYGASSAHAAAFVDPGGDPPIRSGSLPSLSVAVPELAVDAVSLNADLGQALLSSHVASLLDGEADPVGIPNPIQIVESSAPVGFVNLMRAADHCRLRGLNFQSLVHKSGAFDFVVATNSRHRRRP